MANGLRIATYNVENLFGRARLLNMDDHLAAQARIDALGRLQAELGRKTYDKPEILRLYRELKDDIRIVSTRGKLFNRSRTKVTADGRGDWRGWIELKRDRFTDRTVRNTARVIRAVNAHVTCLVEVESRPVLRRFAADNLRGDRRYPHEILVDGNDTRGIDVALLSRFPLGGLWSHTDDRDAGRRIFSRDCLEVEVLLPGGRSLWVLLNHFKSKGYGSRRRSNERRRTQAERVAEILDDGYDLRRDLVVVAGDLNDTPDSVALRPLLELNHLYDVLAETHPDPDERWTYYYRRREQIDYLLVSRPLREALTAAGVERRGIHGIEALTGGVERGFSTVTSPRNAASDHGAVWADFDIAT